MIKILCIICNKEYTNINQHYDTQIHKKNIELQQKEKKERDDLLKILQNRKGRKYGKYKRFAFI